MSLTFGSLFAGIGGFDLGFERAGMECKWQVEIDGYARKVLEKHWPNVRRWDDVRTFPPEPRDDWKVDVICGGFPCQDISYAGRGAGLDGERSGLFFEAIRVVRELQPRFVVLENVAALLTRGLDRVLGTLAEIGFDAEWHCIPAAAVGAPHIRDRVFLYAYRYGEPSMSFNAETCRDTKGVLADTMRGNVEGNRKSGKQKPTLGQRHSATERGLKVIRERGDWATEPAVGRVANGVPCRVDRLRGLGNAVVPQVAEWIGKQLVEGCK